jgi:hypothetical protein
MLNWEKECPELWAMHGPHLAPTYRMAEGQEKEAVAELLRLLKGSGMKLVKSKGEVMLDIKNPELAANNAGQAKRIERILKQYYEFIKKELGPVLDEGA